MKFNIAYTFPINPPSASPVLSHAQVWAGLVKKCRKPQDFVTAISDCEVLEEDDNGLKRVVTFKSGMGPPAGKSTEIITFHGQTTADFLMTESKNFITNTISKGSGENELYLTFTFEWDFPELEEGSKDAQEKGEQLTKQAAEVVPHSIDTIRAWAQEGKL